MSHWVINKRILTLLGLAALCAPTLAGQPRRDDYLVRAIQFLKVLFPAMERTQAVIWDKRDPDRRPYPDVFNRFEVQLAFSRLPESAIVGDFAFDTDTHDMRSVMIRGTSVLGRQEKLEEEIDQHPEWSEQQIVARLKAAGAKFGPDDREAFRRSLPLQQLEPLTGRLEVTDYFFHVRAGLGGPDSPAALGWNVYAKCYSTDGKYETDTILLFESFEGTLWSFSPAPGLPPRRLVGR